MDTSALSSKSVWCQIWKSTSIHERYEACSLAPHVKGFARVDETDALTDLRGLGGSFGSPTVSRTNSVVLQKCIIRPLEEKMLGWGGWGGRSTQAQKKDKNNKI